MTSHFLASYVDLLIDLPPARRSMPWAGWRRRFPSRTIRRPTRRPWQRVRRGQAARGLGRPRRHLGGASGPGAVAKRSSTPTCRCPTRSTALTDDVHDRRGLCCGLRRGPITEAGLSINIDVGLQYLAAWLGGNGCVPIYNLMEDAATAEICRAQVWQWLRHGASLDDGRVITPSLVREAMKRQVTRLRTEVPRTAARNGRRALRGDDFRTESTGVSHASRVRSPELTGAAVSPWTCSQQRAILRSWVPKWSPRRW